MLHIVTIIWGNTYTNDYVDKLYWGIRRHTSIPFKFTCFVDTLDREFTPHVEKKLIPYFTGNWYSKISLYNRELYRPEDQIFYFDLDTVIIDDLNDIFSYTGDFAVLEDFTHQNKYGSGFMSWTPAAVHHLWERFKPGWSHKFGDQAWCEQQYPGADFWQKLYPKKIISYKVHIKRSMRSVPGQTGDLNTASIVCFHGKPNPHEVAESWMKIHWI